MRDMAQFLTQFFNRRIEDVYEVFPEVRSTRNKDGGILLDVHRGRMFRLNPLGALIFEAIQKGQTESQITEELVRQFHVSPEAAILDARDFLTSLERLGLLLARNP